MTATQPNQAGLTSAEAKRLQDKYGKNELSPQKKERFLKKVFHIICEPMFLLLIAAAIIYFILGEPRDGAIMLIFVAGIISIDVIQEWKTDKTLHALKDLSAPHITVMRDGKYIDSRPIGEWTNDSLITAMVGRTLENQFPKKFGVKGPCMLKVEHLSIGGVLRDVSFEAFGGQILGMSGLVGAGRTETVRAIFGADPVDEGAFYIQGKKQKITSPKKAIELGIALLTEDRKNQGLVLAQTIRTNLILSSMKKHSRGFFLHEATIEKNGQDKINTLRIKTPSIDEVVQQLSGGNQQKVVIGKWINAEADIYIFDEPTRGIDVGAKVEVYNVMNALVEAGKCVIMISSEMPEVLGMSDRVLVMRGGRVMALVERDSKHFNQEDIMKAAWGGSLDD